jgi:hypothetical protein
MQRIRHPSISVTQLKTCQGTIGVNLFVQLHAPAEGPAAHAPWIMLINRIFRNSHGPWMIGGPWLYHREHGLHRHIAAQDAHHELVISNHVDTNALDTIMRTVTVVSYVQWKRGLQDQAYYVCRLLSMRSGQVRRINFDAYLLRLVDVPGCLPCEGVPLPGWSAAQFYGMLVRKRLHSSLTVNCGPFITCRIRLRLAEFSQVCAGSPLRSFWKVYAQFAAKGAFSHQFSPIWLSWNLPPRIFPDNTAAFQYGNHMT